ncbi:hypothetical protein BDF19DRAFT_465774 [Syncephalis fuscata]|nr:hypothetical protein BDF19DRAFT_465774 [Syncephalis fuscata]
MSSLATYEEAAVFKRRLNKRYAAELPHLVSAITYRAQIENVTIADITADKLVLNYRHPAGGGSDTLLHTCEVALSTKALSAGQVDCSHQEHVIAQLMNKVKSVSTTKPYVEYFQMPSKSVFITIVALCLYVILLKKTPSAIRPKLFNLMYSIFGDRFITASYYSMIFLHTSETLATLVICRQRGYSWSTTLRWMMGILATGFFTMRFLFNPRPAIKQ